ncbi:MAG: tRNA lysidine(34) synthetase TilS [bacterium]
MKNTEQKVLKFIDRQKLIEPGIKLLVALSGGPDSVFLLHFLKKYERRLKIEIAAVHINHQLRGIESDEDEKFCRELCKNNTVEFHSEKVNVKKYAAANKFSIEEAARYLRYAEFRNVSEMVHADRLATAHNMNDNTETVLLNLFRGTGLKGISGIPIQRQNIIRPLLILTKEEVLAYLHSNKINYRIDKSNLDSSITRNFIRNEIVPSLVRKINPSLHESIFNSSLVFKSSSNLISGFVEEILKENVKHVNQRLEIDLQIVEKFGKDILGEVFKKCLQQYYSKEFTYTDFLKLNDLYENQTGRKNYFSEKLVAYREREKIVLYDESVVKIFEPVELNPGESVSLPIGELMIEETTTREIDLSDKNNFLEFINGNEIEGNFVLRRWEPGDKFVPLGMNEFKKVSDFLNEQKVQSSLKKEQLVLTNRNHIVWILGLRIDNRYKVSSSTKKAYKIWIRKT